MQKRIRHVTKHIVKTIFETTRQIAKHMVKTIFEISVSAHDNIKVKVLIENDMSTGRTYRLQTGSKGGCGPGT